MSRVGTGHTVSVYEPGPRIRHEDPVRPVDVLARFEGVVLECVGCRLDERDAWMGRWRRGGSRRRSGFWRGRRGGSRRRGGFRCGRRGGSRRRGGFRRGRRGRCGCRLRCRSRSLSRRRGGTRRSRRWVREWVSASASGTAGGWGWRWPSVSARVSRWRVGSPRPSAGTLRSASLDGQGVLAADVGDELGGAVGSLASSHAAAAISIASAVAARTRRATDVTAAWESRPMLTA